MKFFSIATDLEGLGSGRSRYSDKPGPTDQKKTDPHPRFS